MKRRDFLINSAAAGAAAVLFAGCSIKNAGFEPRVKTRKFNGLNISLLGFGCSHLPETSGKIDETELERMIDYSLKRGINYFDTSNLASKGQAEGAIGRVLKKNKRESFYLAGKSPIHKMQAREDVRSLFFKQLEKFASPYFDFYMCHQIDDFNVYHYREVQMYDELLRLKKEGRIKFLGFSFHGTPELLKELVKEHKWDFVYLQLNYADWNNLKAQEQYEIVRKENIPVIVMLPLRGSRLINLKGRALEVLKENCPDAKPADFGLRWAASKEGVITVLSGMSTFEQVKENADTFAGFKPMTEHELKTADEIAQVLRAQGEINCTACRYCLSVCPENINIPAVLFLYSEYKVTKDSRFYNMNYKSFSKDERADKCTKCGLCRKICPQHLDIPALLAEAAEQALHR